MKYTEQAFLKADAVLSDRRKTAELQQQKRFDEVSKISHELIEVDRKIKSLNFELLKAISNRTAGVSAKDAVMKIKENNLQAHKKKEDILKSIGYPPDYLEPVYQCSKCMDTGEVDGHRCECFTKLLEEFTFEQRSKDCEFELHDFDQFKLDLYPKHNNDGDPYDQMSKIYQNCLSYAAGFDCRSDSLLFIGNTGLGKTFMCSCIAKSVLQKGYTVVFRSILKVMEDILAEHFGKRTGNTLDDLKDADLLILDDLGSEFSDQSDPMLYQILNDRINLHKPTIVTTNMTAQQINSRYNERIFSRLFGEFKVLPFIGNDIRFERK